LSAFRDFHASRGADASLVLTRQDDCSRFGRIHLAPNDRVVRFEEKPQGGGPGWVNAGIYLIQRALIEEIPPDRPLSLERDLLPGWRSRRLLCALPCQGRFLDIGTPESYSRAEAFFASP
jgi:NDP-sugar pyrophosphorylase family protein